MTTVDNPEAVIEEHPPGYRLADGELQLRFHPGQTATWLSEARIVAMLAGTQSGKTSFGPYWLEREIQRKGLGDYLAVTATFPLLNLKMQREFLHVFQNWFNLGVWRAADRVFESYEKHHGAPAWRVIFGSATNPESLESATANAAWLDEVGQHQFQHQAWEAVQRRVSLTQGRILCTTTLYEFGWFKTEVYDPWVRGDTHVDVIQFDSKTNPAFSQEAYERARETLPRWKFDLFYRGVYTRPAGMIYDCFDESTCVIPRFEIPREWPRYTGHDFGPTNTAAVWFAQDPGTGFLYMYREYLDGGISAFDHAQRYKTYSEGERVMRRVGGSNTEDGWRESFTAAAWPIQKPRLQAVDAGIDRVYGWMAQNKLFVFKDCSRYLDELLSYSRVLDDLYNPTEKIDSKSSYHLMDATRYILGDFSPERAEVRQTVKVVRH